MRDKTMLWSQRYLDTLNRFEDGLGDCWLIERYYKFKWWLHKQLLQADKRSGRYAAELERRKPNPNAKPFDVSKMIAEFSDQIHANIVKRQEASLRQFVVVEEPQALASRFDPLPVEAPGAHVLVGVDLADGEDETVIVCRDGDYMYHTGPLPASVRVDGITFDKDGTPVVLTDMGPIRMDGTGIVKDVKLPGERVEGLTVKV